MPGSEMIVEKILSDAREHAAAIMSAARDKAAAMEEAARAKTAAEHQLAAAEANEAAAQSRERQLRMAELDAKKAELADKRRAIDEAFEQSLELMRQMDAAHKQAFLRRVLVEAADGGETLYPAASEAGLYTDAFREGLNAELAKAGKAAVNVSSSARGIPGGFVLERDGSELNCSYAELIEARRRALELDVARILFPSGVRGE